MIFILSWLLQLNPAATFMSTYIINNPWTMAPLYFVDYIFGNWFLYICFGLNSMTINPSWIEQANTWIAYYTGFKGISFWGFMVGGNLLGILFSVILYPVLLNIFTKMLKTANSQLYQHENNSQEQKSVP